MIKFIGKHPFLFSGIVVLINILVFILLKYFEQPNLGTVWLLGTIWGSVFVLILTGDNDPVVINADWKTKAALKVYKSGFNSLMGLVHREDCPASLHDDIEELYYNTRKRADNYLRDLKELP